MTDLAPALIAAGTSLTPVIGGGVAFIWNKVEQRFKTIEAKLEECHADKAQTKARSAVKLTIIELLFNEVRRMLSVSGQSESPAITRAKQLMDDLKLELPEDDPLELHRLAEKLP